MNLEKLGGPLVLTFLLLVLGLKQCRTLSITEISWKGMKRRYFNLEYSWKGKFFVQMILNCWNLTIKLLKLRIVPCRKFLYKFKIFKLQDSPKQSCSQHVTFSL